MADPMQRARFNMIQQQVRPWLVSDDRVLEAMGGLPRERFVPDAYRGLAYADIQIPLDFGEVMMEPRLVGRMLQALQISPREAVLEIGTGSGYVTACLARLARRVTSLEIHDTLATQARAQLEALAIRNQEIIVGDGCTEPPEGRFAAIAVTGSVPREADLRPLFAHLADGGRLFAVIGSEPAMEAVLFTRVGTDARRRESLFETLLPPLANCPEPADFEF